MNPKDLIPSNLYRKPGKVLRTMQPIPRPSKVTILVRNESEALVAQARYGKSCNIEINPKAYNEE